MVNEPKDNDIDKRLAALGLALESESCIHGPRPDQDELWDFIHGAVSEKRRSEILAYLADDEALFSQWHSLRMTIKEVAEMDAPVTADSAAATAIPDDGMVEPRSEYSWWRILAAFPRRQPWLATGLVTTMIIVVLVLSPSDRVQQNRADFWAEWSQPISVATERLDVANTADLEALLAGVRMRLVQLDYLAQGPFGGELPEQVPPCPDADADCRHRRTSLFELGSLTVESLHLCQHPSVKTAPELPDPTSAAMPVLQQKEPAILLTPLKAWIKAHQQAKPMAACDAAGNVLGRALVQ